MQLSGTNIQAPVVPNSGDDVFATHQAKWGQGGLRTVATLAERDAITLDRREVGMEVKVLETDRKYELRPGGEGMADNSAWAEVTGADVNKAYVDAADAALGTRIDAAGASAAHANDRFDTLVANAPHALDTLKEISDQLAADEQGTAAILATQQQHTQQLANDVVHRTGNETIAGNKHFSQSVVVDGSVTATAFLGDGSQLTNLPTSGDTLAGDWNPATNTPTLTQGTGTKGTYYRVSASNLVLATTANGPSSSTVIGLASVTGIQPGMLVTGYGIADNTTVVSISGKNLTLSAAANGLYGGAPVTAFSIPFGVSMPTFLPGSELFYNGTAWVLRALPLLPATDVQLGGILVGDGLSVGTNGTLAVLPQLAGAYNSSALYAPNVAVTYSGKLYQNASGFSIISAAPGVGFGWKLLDLTGYVPVSSGTLSSLTTTNKTTLVAAINELKAGSGGPASTDALPEGTTNKYHTDARTLATPLTGYTKAASSRVVAATDTVLSAVGVLQKQVDSRLDFTYAWPDLSNMNQVWPTLPSNQIAGGNYTSFNGDVSRALPPDVDPNTNYAGLMYWRAVVDSTITFTKGTVDSASSLRLAAGEWVFLCGLGQRGGAAAAWSIRMRGSLNPTYPNFTPQNIKSALVGATASDSWSNGELIGTQPAGSQPGMKCVGPSYRYEYMNGMNDTDGTTYVWCRTVKA